MLVWLAQCVYNKHWSAFTLGVHCWVRHRPNHPIELICACFPPHCVTCLEQSLCACSSCILTIIGRRMEEKHLLSIYYTPVTLSKHFCKSRFLQLYQPYNVDINHIYNGGDWTLNLLCKQSISGLKHLWLLHRLCRFYLCHESWAFSGKTTLGSMGQAHAA